MICPVAVEDKTRTLAPACINGNHPGNDLCIQRHQAFSLSAGLKFRQDGRSTGFGEPAVGWASVGRAVTWHASEARIKIEITSKTRFIFLPRI
jgi:hypothetical protein